MQFKQFIFIVLCIGFVYALLSVEPVQANNVLTGPIQSPPNGPPAGPKGKGNGKEGSCDPRTIGIAPINAPHISSITQLGLQWCFTFKAIKDVGKKDGYGDGTLVVFMNVILNEIGPRGVQSLEEVSIELDCTKSGPGRVNWDPASKAIYFEGAKIECTTVDLREIGLALSGGAVDICNGQPQCEIPIVNVVNYINMPTYGCDTPFADGTLFAYEEVMLGMNGLAGSHYQLRLDVNGEQLTASAPLSVMEKIMGLAIEQRGRAFDFAANGELLASPQVVGQPVTFFNSWPTPLSFGYNPDTEVYFNGCVKEGIYDPLTGGSVY